MKTTKIAIALILIIAVILVGVVLGFRVFGFGKPQYTNNTQSLSENATLWEKSRTHNRYSMCMNNIEQVGYLSIYSPEKDQIGTISMTISLPFGASPVNITKMNFTISTENYSKTVRDGDLPLRLGGKYQNNNTILEEREAIDILFNISEMGFTPDTLGPDQRFVIVLETPEDGSCNNIFVLIRTSPRSLYPGVITNIP